MPTTLSLEDFSRTETFAKTLIRNEDAECDLNKWQYSAYTGACLILMHDFSIHSM